MPVKLSEVERRLIVLGQFDRKLSVDKLAKLAGCQAHRVRYALERLTEEGVMRPYTFINYYKLGLLHFAAFLSLASGCKRSRNHFLDAVRQSSCTCWSFELGGAYQYLVTVMASSPGEVYRFMHALPRGVRFTAKSIALRLGWYNFSCKYLCPGLSCAAEIDIQSSDGPLSVDRVDCDILRVLSDNTAAPQAEICRMLGLPSSTVSSRIQRLEKSGIIRAYAYWVDCSTFGAFSCRLVIYEHGSDARLEQKLLSYARRHPHVVGFVRCLGSWDFELRVEVWEASQLNALIDEIYDEFGSAIEAVQSLPVLNCLKTTSHPSAILDRWDF